MRAKQHAEAMVSRLKKRGYRVLSLECLRNAFPFSRADHKSALMPVPDLANVNDAVRAYQRPKDYFGAPHYMVLHDRADYQGAPPELRLFVWRFMRALRARGLPFYVHTCYRSPASQLEQLAEGHSLLRSGSHQRSAAVDIVSAIDHWEVPRELWYYVGTLGESVARGTHFGQGLEGRPLKIEWGGRWRSFYDPAHWQLSDWRKRPVIDPGEPVRVSPYSDAMRFG